MIGPTVIPFRNMSGKYEGTPHLPALHGRYLPVDLDENNRAPAGTLGWGVCRQGFGLQNLPRMTREQAHDEARRLNAIVPTAEREAFNR